MATVLWRGEGGMLARGRLPRLRPTRMTSSQILAPTVPQAPGSRDQSLTCMPASCN